MPPSAASGAPSGAITSRSSASAPAKPSASVPPVTVSASPWSSGASSFSTARIPPARCSCSTRCSPEGRTFASSGVRLRELVEAVERQRHADAAGEREQMDDGVRPAADRHQQRDRVVERLGGEDPRRAQPFARQLDGASAGRLRGAHACGVDGRDRRRSRQAHPERLDERRHRRGGAHLVAVSGARRRGRFELVELRLGHPPGAQLVGVVPEVGAGAELPPAEPRGLRRPAGDHDRRHVGARRAHQLRGHRLVAAAEQDDGVERIGADALLDVHRHQVAEEHRRRLHQVLAERDRRELERQAAGEQDAALDRLGERAEVQVAVDELRPRVADPDHRPAGERAARDPLGVQRRAVDESRQVSTAEPARAAQLAHAPEHPTRER